jgi:NAD(P)-dependent dehydrogenase (short-subunit alcohol dehydrogenase family)
VTDARAALIVGASRGIGLGLTAELAGRGWHVTATRRDAAPGLVAGPGIDVERVDITDAASARSLAERLAGHRFRLVLLNAGIYGPREATATDASPELVATLFETNAMAPIRLARLLLPMLGEGGTLAFMLSRMGSVAANTTGGGELYRASKAALNSLTRSLVAQDLAGRRVVVLTLHPGWVRTDMGGAGATLSVEESVRGLADVLEAAHPPGHHFLDHQGATLPW